MLEWAIAIITIVALGALCYWLFIAPRQRLKKLSDQVVDETTQPIISACLLYAQGQLTEEQFERFKILFTNEITNGPGGLNLARLVERCIAECKGEVE